VKVVIFSLKTKGFGSLQWIEVKNKVTHQCKL